MLALALEYRFSIEDIKGQIKPYNDDVCMTYGCPFHTCINTDRCVLFGVELIRITDKRLRRCKQCKIFKGEKWKIK